MSGMIMVTVIIMVMLCTIPAHTEKYIAMCREIFLAVVLKKIKTLTKLNMFQRHQQKLLHRK